MMDLNTNYEVISYIVGDTKAGTKMGKLQLKSENDGSNLNCILWEETINRLDPKIFKTGNVVKLLTASYNEKFNNCLVTNLELVEEALCGLDKQTREEKFQDLIEIVNVFQNDKLKTFLLDYLNKHSDLIKVAPAAKAMHHNYVGGLLIHTLECLDIAFTLYPKLNNKVEKEELFAACILHDIGKIYEYSIDIETGFIEYSESFKKDWLTHSQYGFNLAMGAGFKNVAKMVASHHSRTEWGSMIDLSERDLEPMYYIVHHIDDLSAKFGKISVREL